MRFGDEGFRPDLAPKASFPVRIFGESGVAWHGRSGHSDESPRAFGLGARLVSSTAFPFVGETRDRERRAREDGLGRPGSDLLSRVLRRSTIGAEGFHGRVRNGNGLGPLARTTGPAKTI